MFLTCPWFTTQTIPPISFVRQKTFVWVPLHFTNLTKQQLVPCIYHVRCRQKMSSKTFPNRKLTTKTLSNAQCSVFSGDDHQRILSFRILDRILAFSPACRTIGDLFLKKFQKTFKNKLLSNRTNRLRQNCRILLGSSCKSPNSGCVLWVFPNDFYRRGGPP